LIIIDVKDGESIDRALRRYKKKHQRVGLIKEIRKRKEYVKPSVSRRHQLLKAKYKQAKFAEV